jgi:hypothetical protein
MLLLRVKSVGLCVVRMALVFAPFANDVDQ